MKTKNRITLIISILITLIFVSLTWIILDDTSKDIINYYINLVPSESNIQLMSLSMQHRENMTLLTTISFGFLPLIAYLLSFLISKLNVNKNILLLYFKYLGILIIAYTTGLFLKHYWLTKYLTTFNKGIITTDIVDTIYVDDIYFYDWSIFLSISIGLLVFILDKKSSTKNKNN